MISSSQRPLPDNTQHSQQTDIHATGGIRNHNLGSRAAADLCHRPRGHLWTLDTYIPKRHFDSKIFRVYISDIFHTHTHTPHTPNTHTPHTHTTHTTHTHTHTHHTHTDTPHTHAHYTHTTHIHTHTDTHTHTHTKILYILDCSYDVKYESKTWGAVGCSRLKQPAWSTDWFMRHHRVSTAMRLPDIATVHILQHSTWYRNCSHITTQYLISLRVTSVVMNKAVKYNRICDTLQTGTMRNVSPCLESHYQVL